MQTIICMKWGIRYGPEFVNRLYKSINKHTKRKTKLYCLTESKFYFQLHKTIDSLFFHNSDFYFQLIN